MIGARIELRPSVGESSAVGGHFRAKPKTQPEPLGGVEKIVAAVIADCKGRSGDQESLGILNSSAAEHTALVGRKPLHSVAPGPRLLPNEVALALDVRGKIDGLGSIGSELLVRDRELCIESLVALEEVRTAKLDAEQLLGRSSDPS